MPVRQERFKRLMDAADLFLRKDQHWRSFLTETLHRVGQGFQTPQGALEDIRLQLSITAPYDRAELVIKEEQMRHALTYKKLLTERERIKQRRLGNRDWVSKDLYKDMPDVTVPDMPLGHKIGSDDPIDLTDDIIAMWGEDTDPLDGETEAHRAEVAKAIEMLHRIREQQEKEKDKKED